MSSNITHSVDTSTISSCLAFLSLALSACSVTAASVSHGIDAEADLPYWEVSSPGMTLRLVQRVPDQTRAFFMARGFSAEAVEPVARSCVFQTIFRNTSQPVEPSPVEYNLRDWTVITDRGRLGLKTREDWKRVWEQSEVSGPARIAFEWALFPTHQVYQPGDYNWGMSIFDLVPGSELDLKVVWHQYGERHEAIIPDMRCAADE